MNKEFFEREYAARSDSDLLGLHDRFEELSDDAKAALLTVLKSRALEADAQMPVVNEQVSMHSQAPFYFQKLQVYFLLAIVCAVVQIVLAAIGERISVSESVFIFSLAIPGVAYLVVGVLSLFYLYKTADCLGRSPILWLISALIVPFGMFAAVFVMATEVRKLKLLSRFERGEQDTGISGAGNA